MYVIVREVNNNNSLWSDRGQQQLKNNGVGMMTDTTGYSTEARMS